ncbi:hypothetical protein TBLA_0D00600 [Henningerozyma blattae CBS 6284]|uniref:Ubiquitin-conjugating enzyme E2 6 n=1 Tax=Henningerozyma blattae (strain ATCC 34711 / CBS 6284 / DSM 70876 / NBRC 10599 / NRRL Y-10934 / UCD 77-7) TaxID=1071380 RepID=I2H2G5_HENB6|nr:hypothetical protein TBLA_0D00600 [Tetrapisispora blattae CBS 6284]CCH60567.1 hypothetical protein TBLA_0D00600 [Tetrapisispora blattae CBS 6284]
MATKQAHKRLTKEYKMMVETPPPYITARPNESNILEWHYIIIGPQDTPYDGGQYHGTLTFPSDYPYKPPAIRMITPNGRFKENTRLCLSMSDYHPDTWNPGWSVATILNGLLSFMTGNEDTTGSVSTSDQQKRIYAKKSMDWNTYQSARFRMVFPDIVESNEIELARHRKMQGSDSNSIDESSKMKNNSIDSLVRAAQEKVIDLKDIQDPEDRIRANAANARLIEESNRAGGNLFSNNKLYIVAAVLLLFLGISMK